MADKRETRYLEVASYNFGSYLSDVGGAAALGKEFRTSIGALEIMKIS